MNTGVVPGYSAHDELADLVAAGLTPWQALRAATVNGAEFLGAPGDHGTIFRVRSLRKYWKTCVSKLMFCRRFTSPPPYHAARFISPAPRAER
jgi:hypothetical protein